MVIRAKTICIFRTDYAVWYGVARKALEAGVTAAVLQAIAAQINVPTEHVQNWAAMVVTGCQEYASTQKKTQRRLLPKIEE